MRRAPTFDIHVHLAGTGANGSGCWLAPHFRTRYTFRLLRILYGISEAQLEGPIDDDWAELVSKKVRESGLDYAVALGFDGVYDARGELDRERTQMIVPPSWVFEVCRHHPNLLPGPSVNPFRADALDRLEECISGGAALIKWLPLAQGIDPSSPRLEEFYQLLSAARLPLLIHMGGERTFGTIAPELNDVRLLEAPLKAGVPVICAHSATRILFSGEPDQLPLLRALLGEYPHLWVDNSGMANPARFAHLPRLAGDPLFRERTLHGSDFPVPSSAIYYLPRLGPREVWRLERQENVLARDVAIKLRFGYPEETLTRPARVLAHLDRWGVPVEVDTAAAGGVGIAAKRSPANVIPTPERRPRMPRKLEDSVIVITGASSGIGRATALAFADRGATVVLAARRREALEEVARECEGRGGRALAVPTNTASEAEVESLARQAVENFGRIDVWVNNAAVTLFGRIDEVPMEDFRQVIETNVFGYVHGTRAALRYFREQGAGVLVSVDSVVASAPQPYTSAYVMSKYAIRALDECLRMELSLDEIDDIHVCTVMPASIDTPFFQQAANYTGREIKALDPTYPPEKVADAIVGMARKPRREVIVGRAGRMMAAQHAMAPGLYEKMGARQIDRDHFQDQPADPSDGNLFQPMPEHASIRGGWRSDSAYSAGKIALAGLAVALPAAVAILANRHQ